MKHIVVVPFDGFKDAVFSGLKEFPTEKIILISSVENAEEAGEAVEELARFSVPAEVETVEDENSLEEVFAIFSRIRAREKGKDVIVNVGAASGTLSCSALSASFVNGLKAFEVMNNKLILFPILKFSYYDLLSDKKMEILRLLYSQNINSLEELSQKLKIGPSLVNYHIYGNEKNPGLKELGLLEIEREKGKIKAKVSTLGRLLLKEKTFETPEKEKTPVLEQKIKYS